LWKWILYLPTMYVYCIYACIFIILITKMIIILYLTTMYVYCILCLSCNAKNPKHLPNCLKINETSVILIVFNGVICDVRACTVTVSSCCSTWPNNNTEVYLNTFIILAAKQARKAWQRLVFLSVSKARANKLYIFRQCTYIVYA
jgi:hypothetical protein